ncbi:NYN domain-containing protein [Candidatus Curtissbacteria bacterium]|nr:NYN domain-containing protein [Candidatus Curtissbacteria bacterium]
MKRSKKTVKTYAFVDASNIIYGTRDDGWKVDFKKLFKYLKERYNCKAIYYFGGVEKNNEKQQSFYRKLRFFGYELVLKPVKIYRQPDGGSVRKANCDVDLTFYAMRDKDKFDRGIFMTGDGDFAILLEYLIKSGKQVQVIASGKRTARELRRVVREYFTEIGSLRQLLKYKKR